MTLSALPRANVLLDGEGNSIIPVTFWPVTAKRYVEAFHEDDVDYLVLPIDELTWDADCKDEASPMNAACSWYTRCGRYRVTRVTAVYGAQSDDMPVYFVGCYRQVVHDKKRRYFNGLWNFTELVANGKYGNYPIKYNELDKCMKAVEDFHRRANELESITTNRKEVIAKASLSKLDVAPRWVAPQVIRGAGSSNAGQTTNGGQTGHSVQRGASGARPARGGARDKYGFLEGSVGNKMGKALTTEPSSMQDIVKRAGLTGTHYNVLNNLAKAGVLTKNGNSYALKKK